MSRWQWLLMQLGRRLWLRVSLFALGAVLTALVGIVLPPLLPEGLPTAIGPDAIDGILEILASSMLAVTTFSLATMVAAYGAASTNATPRATRLMTDDPVTQNALSTFIGSFIFSLVGLIALSTEAYGEKGRLILFLATLAVVVLIVITLLRWIDYLTRLGRVGETVDRVAGAARRALDERAANPHLGGRPLAHSHRAGLAGSEPLFPEAFGYVQHIDMPALEACAEKAGGSVYVLTLPGAFVDPGRPLAHLDGITEDEQKDAVREAFTIGDERSFDQDPRFGICVLAEIASRALSPGINDPGTAIDVIGTGVQTLARWADQGEPAEPRYPNVLVPALSVDDLFDDFFTPIARDGTALVEVQRRLQKALLILARADPGLFGDAARRHAGLALARAEKALVLDAEKKLVRQAAAELLNRPAARSDLGS